MAFAPFVVVYTPEPTSPFGRAQDGALALMEWTVADWDGADATDDPDPGNLGIYNPRDIFGNQWPDWVGGKGSQHARGAALDVRFPTVVGGHPEGWKYARWLVANHAILGVQEVIYGGKRWTNQTKAWRVYNGPSPHNDHVHVTLNASGARYLTRARILSVAPTPPATNDPQEDDMPRIVKGNQTSKLFVSDGIRKRPLANRAEADVLAFSGMAQYGPGGKPWTIDQAVLDRIPVTPAAA